MDDRAFFLWAKVNVNVNPKKTDGMTDLLELSQQISIIGVAPRVLFSSGCIFEGLQLYFCQLRNL